VIRFAGRSRRTGCSAAFGERLGVVSARLAVCEAGESKQSAGMAGVAEDADLGVGEACLLLDRGDLVIAVAEGESFLGEGALRVRGMFWRIW